MGLSGDYGKKAVLLNFRSGLSSEMCLTGRSIHSSRGMLVKKNVKSKETIKLPWAKEKVSEAQFSVGMCCFSKLH